MKKSAFFLVSFLLCQSLSLRGQAPVEPVTRVYRVQQNVTLAEVPAGAKTVKWWISIPGDDRYQEVLDFSVASAPGSWRAVTEPVHGNRFILVEVASPTAKSLVTKIEFTLRRRSVFAGIDPAKVGPITPSHQQLFADELRKDAPHMEVTPQITKLADEACGAETNVATQAKLLLGKVADTADHYSKDPTKPKFGVGDAANCMINGGGTCTDMHSLFIALARSRGIPARLQMGYRLRESNEDKEVDPGYRCWAEYFVPGYGWVPTDVVEADDPKGLGRDRWFTGLTERRLWLNEGREFDLAGRAATAHRVNLMVIGYAEIDGVEARVLPEGNRPAQLTRTVRYTEVRPDVVAVAVK
jgi:transglutaminase-like putative cysteine protease